MEETAKTPIIIDKNHETRDLRLVASAIKRGWTIPPEVMAALPLAMAEIVQNGDDRAKVAAGRLLIAMHGQNQNSKPVVQRVKHSHQFVAKQVPVTEENLEERRRLNLERLAAGRQDAGGNGSN